MTNNEITQGEIIRQNNIVTVLEKLGFKQDEDFIFLRNDTLDPYVFVDGDRPLYAVHTGQYADSVTVFSEHAKDNVVIPLVSETTLRHVATDADGFTRYGITDSNNGIGALYIPGQGMIISPSYEINDIMREFFFIKDIHFGVPLSNSEQFRDKHWQEKWKHVLNNKKYMDSITKGLPHDDAEQKRKDKIRKIMRETQNLEEQLKPNNMPAWAREQLNCHKA